MRASNVRYRLSESNIAIGVDEMDEGSESLEKRFSRYSKNVQSSARGGGATITSDKNPLLSRKGLAFVQCDRLFHS